MGLMLYYAIVIRIAGNCLDSVEAKGTYFLCPDRQPRAKLHVTNFLMDIIA